VQSRPYLSLRIARTTRGCQVTPPRTCGNRRRRARPMSRTSRNNVRAQRHTSYRTALHRELVSHSANNPRSRSPRRPAKKRYEPRPDPWPYLEEKPFPGPPDTRSEPVLGRDTTKKGYIRLLRLARPSASASTTNTLNKTEASQIRETSLSSRGVQAIQSLSGSMVITKFPRLACSTPFQHGHPKERSGQMGAQTTLVAAALEELTPLLDSHISDSA
jgi:hypothetical protein